MSSANSDYIVCVIENHTTKYLFDSQVLVSDIALARHFSSQPLAKRYLQKSCFAHCAHRTLPVHASRKHQRIPENDL